MTLGTGKMIGHLNRLINVIKALNKSRSKFVVVGGVACNLHGLVRATKDIDLLIPKEIKNTKKILNVLESSLSFGLAGELDPELVSQRPFTIIGDQPRVDLITKAGNLSFDQVYQSSERSKVEGTTIPFANIETLLIMKRTSRPTDIADVQQLKLLRKMKTK